MEQDFMRNSLRLAMRFDPARLYMMADTVDYDFYRGAMMSERPLEFRVRQVASNMTVQLMESSFAFKPIDAMPQFTEEPRKSIEDFGIFATPLVRTEEIIVEPATVMELLDKIKSMQAPELAEVRKRNARRNDIGSEVIPLPRTNFHAQIMSIAA